MWDERSICLGLKAPVGYRAVLGGKARVRVIAALVGALVFTASPFPKAGALTSDEGSLLSYTNSERGKYGKPSVSLASDLNAVARRHSARMAERRAIYHNSNLPSEARNWRKIGENVGRGPSVSAVHRAFMGSSSHRTHILDGAYDRIGIGVVEGSDGLLYVTEVFVDRTSGATRVAPRRRTAAGRPSAAPPVVRRRVVRRAPRPAPPAPPPPPPPAFATPMTVGMLLRLVAMDAEPASPAIAKPLLR